MSLRSMKAIAIERDTRRPRRPVSRTKRGKDAVHPEDEGQDYRDALVSAIPTEVLAPYTALIAGIVATIDPGEENRTFLRWSIYIAGLLAIIAYLGLSYSRQKGQSAKRKFPWAETGASLFAFGAWGLVMPDSPLSISLKGDDLVIWTLIITIGGAFVVGLISGTSLNKKAS